jgi:hypothetical protein
MKNKTTITFIILILTVLFANGQEIYTQGNATSLVNESNSTDGWTSLNTNISVETTDVYDGQYALKITAATDSWARGVYSFPTTTGIKYKISINAKIVNSERAGFWSWKGFSDFDGGQQLLTGGWNKYEFLYTGDGTAAQLRIYTGDPSVAGNSVLIDAMSILPYVEVTGLTMNPSSVSLNVGQTHNLSPTFSPSTATNVGLNWSSSDSSIATVSNTGMVTTIAEGDVSVTATTIEGGFTASTSFTVSVEGTNPLNNTQDCPNDIANLSNDIVFSDYRLGSGADSKATVANSNGSCGIRVVNNDINQPWAKYQLVIDLAANGLVSGDELDVSAEVFVENGVGRLELVQDNTSNTALISKTFSTDNSSPNLTGRITIPSGITTLNFWLHCNYNLSNQGGSVIYSNLSVSKVSNTLPSTPVGESIWLENNTIASYSGKVGIGTTNPGDYELAVNGEIRSKEVKVETANWPDYVFTKNYKLPTLDEVQKHIEQNGHLMNIPSAKEAEANGVELGEMNRLLLEKLEELTLYIIQLKKENDLQQEQINQLITKK